MHKIVTWVWNYSDSKVHVAHMGPNWVLLAPGGHHAGPMNLAIRVYMFFVALAENEANHVAVMIS